MHHGDDESEAVPNGNADASAEAQLKSLLDEEGDPSRLARISDPVHPIYQKVMQENQKYWQNKFLFGAEYFEFISELTHFWDTVNPVPLRVLNRNND